MSRVITFSRYFPATHPKKGQPTGFVEKLWKGFEAIGYSEPQYFFDELKGLDSVISGEAYNDACPKNHTIRSGNLWKVGDKFSPRVWGNDINPKTGKSGPYHSKQIIIAPDIEIKKIWEFEMQPMNFIDECKFFINSERVNAEKFRLVAKNDGLIIYDFATWFAGSDIMSTKRKPFAGQIICWNESIEY